MKLSIALLLVLLSMLQFKLWLAPDGVMQTWRLINDVKAQTVENNALEARNVVLEAEVNDLKNGHAAIEERARSELGMLKEGEVFYQIVD